MTIKANHPAREAFAGRSTNGKSVGYYETKGHALNAFDDVLEVHALCLDRNGCFDMYGNDGYRVFDICDDSGDVVGAARISWYRMPSGRYEFTGYIC